MKKIEPLSELSDLLSKDHNGEERDRLIGNIAQWLEKEEEALKSPLGPDDFKSHSAAMAAYKAADHIVSMIWGFYHILPQDLSALSRHNENDVLHATNS